MKTELEKRIKSEFDNMDVDVNRLIQGIKNPPENPAKRPRLRYSGGKLAAAIIIAIVLMASGVAAAIYIGSFDRLLEILGSEYAETLQPMGDLIDEITIDNFKVEILAVGIDANVVDIYLTIEDLIGGRLDNGFGVSIQLTSMTDAPIQYRSAFSHQREYIYRTESGIITVHHRHIFLAPVTGQILALRLTRFSHSYTEAVADIGIDLSALYTHTPAAWLWNTPILPLNIHDIEINAPQGFVNAQPIRISGIGLIDGRLHIQTKYNNFPAFFDGIQVIDPYGEVVPPIFGRADETASLSFGIDDDGNIYNDRGFNWWSFPYAERIYDVDTARLSEYRLISEFFSNVLWEPQGIPVYTFFEVELPDEVAEPLSANELNMWLDCSGVTIHDVRVTPFTVFIEGFSPRERGAYGSGLKTFPPYGGGYELPRIVLNMADGEIVTISRGSLLISWVLYRHDEETMTNYYCYSHHFTEIMAINARRIDLGEVASIQIAELVIPLR